MKKNIRFKLIISMIAVVMLTGIGAIIINIFIVNENILHQQYDEVLNNLNTAQYIYDNKIRLINLFIKHLSSLSYIKTAIQERNRELLINKLKDVKSELNIDILNITDPHGKILVRAHNPGEAGDDVSTDIMIRQVLTDKMPIAGTTILSKEHLIKEGADLFKQAFITVIKTPRSRKKTNMINERGMVMMAASPIILDNKLIGIVYGAKLLNNNFEFVDKVKSLVFKNEKIDGVEIGTATLFLDDLRISTNVSNRDGSRAIGTLISEEVYEKVVEQKKLWLAKAFVVNNWYISAYTPIYDIQKKVVGILYVGILEEKHNRIKRNTYFYFLLMIGFADIVALGLSIFLIHNIVNPIKKLVDGAMQITMGNYKKINVSSKDEMGYLCSTFNKMVDAIDERDRKLKEQTEMKIIQSEKLASLGRLASGIAHEINNPLTGILAFSGELRKDLAGTEYESDLQTIIDETLRCRNIVKGILEFARETKIEKQKININEIITGTLGILEKHVNFHNITINRMLADDIPDMNLDINQMKSVINNLCVNAADAMPAGGTLTIRTVRINDGAVTIEIEDTGIGIDEATIDKIFDPFFSTKETGKGTGLGLSVTYGIINRHNGTITAKSVPGKGTIFTITLPVNQDAG